MSTAVAFQAYWRPLETMWEFKSLGRMLTALDDDWPAVAVNMSNSWRRWEWISRILVREGADPRASGTFYKAMVQATLLFGVETWVVIPRIGRTLGSFHHRVARRLVGIWTRRYMMGR